MPSWLKTASLYASAFATAALFSTACDPSYGITSFRCDPSDAENGCPTKYGTGGTYICCSDDPASLDPAAPTDPSLPSYASNGTGTGIPLYAAAGNNRSSSGFCVDTSQVSESAGIADEGDGQGCPLPCNPTWSDADINTVCGDNTSCCATIEIEEEDCIFDPSMGDAGCHRPATGNDIMGLGGTDTTKWSKSAHATHQDPNAGGCDDFVIAEESALAAAGLSAEDARISCIRQLSVANQRGYCQGAMDCPLADPNHRDACELLNDQDALTGCDPA